MTTIRKENVQRTSLVDELYLRHEVWVSWIDKGVGEADDRAGDYEEAESNEYLLR